MTTQTEALKLALEALEQIDAAMPFPVAKLAIKKAEEALAQPEQDKERCVGCEACIDTACGRDECPKGWPKAAQPEQELMARSDAYDKIDRFLQNNLNSDADYAEYSKALDSIYTTPPQRKPLTDEQVREITKRYALSIAFPYDNPTTPEMFARAIEADHGIKEQQ